MSVLEFGFDDANVIKPTGVEVFKQSRPNEKSRVSVISFRTILEVQARKKARERGSALSNEEMAELAKAIDKRIGETLGKDPASLTAVDRLDVSEPRFWMSFVHSEYKEGGGGVGTIQCLSKYEGNTCVKPDVCCDKFGDADQRVACVVLVYPIDDSGQVDMDLLRQRKYTRVCIWALSAKKFGKLDGAYKDARADSIPVIDLKVTLDGDPKFQKQLIERASAASWARKDTDPEVRHWVLDQGIRAAKYVEQNLGFKLSKEKLLEKLGGGPALSGAAAAATPSLQSGYGDLLK
jgi:hypothetical protein